MVPSASATGAMHLKAVAGSVFSPRPTSFSRCLRLRGLSPATAPSLRLLWTLRIVTILSSSQPPLLHVRAVPAGTVPGAAPNDADANKISRIFAEGRKRCHAPRDLFAGRSFAAGAMHLRAVTSPFLPGTGAPHFPGVCDCRDCPRQRHRRCSFCGIFGL